MKGLLLIFLFVLPLLAGEAYKDINIGKYPNADYVIIENATDILLNEDGTGTIDNTFTIKCLTDKGVKTFAEYILTYTTIYSKLNILEAYLITGDGKKISIKLDEIKDTPMSVREGDVFLIPNVREKHIVYAGLTKGGVVCLKYKEEIHNPVMKGHYDYVDNLQVFAPIKYERLSISLPSNKALYYKVYNDDKGLIVLKESQKGNNKQYTWEGHDIEAIEYEAGMPPLNEIAPYLVITTVPDWKTWSRWYSELSLKSFELDDELKKVTDELISGKEGEIDKATAIYHWVTGHIRYVETSLKGRTGGFNPELAPVTYKRKYGVCRDMAAIMVGMCRYAGLDAKIVLTNPGLKVYKDIAADQFNHAIVALKIGNDWVFSDPTAQNTRELLAAYEKGREVLICTTEGEDLGDIPLGKPEDNQGKVSIKGKITEDGGLEAQGEVSVTGLLELILRSMMKNTPETMRKNLFSMILKRSYPALEIKTFDITGLENLDKPLKITGSFTVPKYMNAMGDMYAFSPFLSDIKNVVNMRMGRGGGVFDLEERKQAIYSFISAQVILYVEIEIPAGYKVITLTGQHTMTNPIYSFKTESKVDGNKIVYTSQSDVFKGLIPAKDYKHEKAKYNETVKWEKEQFILKKE